MAQLSVRSALFVSLAGSIGLAGIAIDANAGMPDDRRNDPVPKEWQRARPVPRVPTSIAPQNDTTVSISHIEVTQAIQDVGHTVPLLAGRGAYVRVFLNIGGTTANADSALVSGKLVATLPNGNTITLDNLYGDLDPRVLGSQNGNLEVQRSDALSGLAFLLPREVMAAGQIRVSLGSIQERDGRRQISCTNCAEVARTVSVTDAAPTFRLTVIGISYTFNGVVHEPRLLDFAMIPSWLKRAYPIGELVYETRVLPYPVAGFHPPVSRRPPPALPTEFNCGDVNTFISQIRAADVAGGVDPRTHYYGLVYEGDAGQTRLFMRGCASIPSAPNPSAPASGPTGASTMDWDDSGSYGGWYTGHELGHTLGRWHVGGACGEVGRDPNFPFPNGAISGPAASFVGFDPGDATIEPRLSPLAMPGTNVGGRQGHDIMSYCPWQWMSAYSYSNILSQIVAENAIRVTPPSPIASAEPNPTSMLLSGPPSASGADPKPPPRGARLLHVIVRLDQNWASGRLVSVMPGVLASAPAAVGNAPIIETITADGRILSRFPAPVQIFDNDGPDHDNPQGAGLINATIPIDDEVTGIRIVHGSRVLAETRRDSSRTMIALSVPSSPGRSALQAPSADRPMTLTWQGRHAGGLALGYTVQVSADGGASWQTVGVGLTEPHIDVALKALSASVRARIAAGQPLKYKVIASDGFNTAELVEDVR